MLIYILLEVGRNMNKRWSSRGCKRFTWPCINLLTWSWTAFTTRGWQWPVFVTAIPQEKSRSERPSYEEEVLVSEWVQYFHDRDEKNSEMLIWTYHRWYAPSCRGLFPRRDRRRETRRGTATSSATDVCLESSLPCLVWRRNKKKKPRLSRRMEDCSGWEAVPKDVVKIFHIAGRLAKAKGRTRVFVAGGWIRNSRIRR